MKFKDKYFPYPVIRKYNDDFLDSTFDIRVKQHTLGNDLIIDAEVEIDNRDIIEEIKNGNAHYVIHVEESETMYRKIFVSDENIFQFNISLDKVRRELEVASFIVVKNQIKDFYSNDLALIYEGITVEYDRNNIIGIGSSYKLDVKKEDDDIEGVSSIFMIIPDEKIEDTFQLVLDKNRVTLRISNDSFKLYNDLSKSYGMSNSDNNIILMSLIVLPAFVETLNILSKDHESYRDYVWFDSLIEAYMKKNVDLLEEFNKEDFDSYRFAQIIFDDVIHNSLLRLKHITMEE
jgi:hypothetical protein